MGTLLRIDVEIARAEGKITIRRGARKIGPFEFDPEIVAQLRDRMAGRLDREVISKLDEKILTIRDWKVLHDAIGRLDTMGRAFLHVIFGTEGTRQLSGLVAEEVAFVKQGFDYTCSRPAPIVELFVNVRPGKHNGEQLAKLVPVEFFPIFGPPDIPAVFDKPSFMRAMARFLGMFAVVQRSGLWDVDQRRHIECDQGVPMKLFVHHGQAHAEHETRTFDRLRNAKLVNMQEAWPPMTWAAQGIDRQAGRQKIFEMLLDQLVGFDGTSASIPDQIHHVFCHAESQSTNFMDDNIQLSSKRDQNTSPVWYKLTVEDMLAQLSYRTSASKLPRTAILFLNACASSSISPKALASLPAVFLQTHRGLIGTEAKVPTHAAAAFSRSFYRALFSGFDIGQSLYQAKWALARQYNHPAGILYTLYAKPDLYVDLKNAMSAGHKVADTN